MRSELDVLLDKVADPTLRANIRSQVDRLQAKRTFGLVFESHLPERVRLPEHEIRVGVRVAYRDDPASAAFEVIAIKKKTATLRKVRNPDGSVLSSAQEADVIAAVTRIEGRAPDRCALPRAVAPAWPPEWRRTRSQRRRQKGGRRIRGLELTR